MKLPVRFFDTKMTGDLIQRISDNHRVETFLSSSTLSILFSFFSLIIFSIVIAFYSTKILILFLAGSILYALWIAFFMKKRRELDYKQFTQLADNQSKMYQLITGMQEIKLNNCEKQKRWEWEQVQGEHQRPCAYAKTNGRFGNYQRNKKYTYHFSCCQGCD
jgi:ATP-binding cassette subfamily B protein